MKLNRSLSTILIAVALIFGVLFAGMPAMAAGTHAAMTHAWPDHSWALKIMFGGLVVNSASLQTIFLNLRATFMKAFDGAPIQWNMTAMLVPSTGASTQYDWLDRFPDFRQW